VNLPWTRFFQHDGYQPGQIEHARLPRLLVFLTVTVAILATAQVTESNPYLALFAIVASGLGSVISWQRRSAKNWWIKLILALLMLVALANFLYEIAANPYDPRIPLAHLLIWLQVLHSFDLPRRKDVFYSLWVALILISVAATASRDNSFGFFLVLYAGLSLASLIASHLSSQAVSVHNFRLWRRFSLPSILLILGSSVLVYALLPRYDGMKVQTFPVSMKIEGLPAFNGEIKNPAYPSRGGQGSQQQRQKREFDPYAYYGFSTSLDLNYRGQLADHVVMRVRSSIPSYWRGMAFDQYDGLSWSMARPYELKDKTARRPPIWIREAQKLQQNIVPRERVVQTFYIEYDQSNLIFNAPYAEFIYFPADYIMVDSYGGLRSPIELFKNTAYTLVSDIPNFSAVKLREVSWEQARRPEVEADYYALPPLPARVQTLTQELSAQATNPFDAVKALETHLKERFPYDLNVPEFPEHRDTVDYFLFEQQAGYCEHFASSLAVMARQLGLASRLVTGYTTGQYNPMTGYFEVRGNDAHGWVEIYFPHHGWVPFDPTPGFSASLSQTSVNQESSLKQIWNYFLDMLPDNLKKQLNQFWQALANLLAKTFGFLMAILTFLPLRALILCVSAAIAITLLIVFWRYRQQQSSQNSRFLPSYATDPQRREFVHKYLELLALLNPNSPDREQLTPHEQLAQLTQELSPELQAELRELTERYYEIRYAQAPLETERLALATQRMAVLKRELRDVQRQRV